MAASDGIKQRKIVQEVSENSLNQSSILNSIPMIVRIAHPFLYLSFYSLFLGNRFNSYDFEFILIGA